MLIEQFVLAQLAKRQGKSIATFFDTPSANIGYTEFDDFHQMYQRGYWHLMGQWKQHRHNLKMLSAELRQRCPHTYYTILKRSKQAGIRPDVNVYTLPELDVCEHSVCYFTSLATTYQPARPLTEPVNWLQQYAKDIVVHETVKNWLWLDADKADKQAFILNADFELLEQTEPELKQQVKFPDTCTLDYVTVDLDEVSMIIVDAFSEGSKTVQQLVDVLTPYFRDEETQGQTHLLAEVIRNRIKKLLFWGVVRPENKEEGYEQVNKPTN